MRRILLSLCALACVATAACGSDSAAPAPAPSPTHTLAVPALADIRTALGTNNSLGMVPGRTFGAITMPACTQTGGTAVDFDVTYSISGLPSWLSFDASTRIISLASGTTFPTGANTASAVIYTCTDSADSTVTASTESFTINDLDGGGVIDGMEYKFGEVPLVNWNFGLINLTPGNEDEYRTSTAAKIPTGIIKTAVGLVPTTASDDTADFDGDGALNSAEITAGTNPFVALSNAGFSSKTDITVGTYPVQCVSADFDGDGNLDLAVANTTSNTVSILLGNGAGTLTIFTTLTGFLMPGTLAAAEFNGDGIIDLAVPNPGSGSGTTVSIYFGNGNGNFTSNATLTVAASPSSVMPGDIDGDSDVDLVIISIMTSTVTLFTNNGSGSFTNAGTLTTGSWPGTSVLADIDNDGDLDIFSPDWGTSGNGTTVSFFLGNGSGGFGARQTLSLTGGTGPHGVSAADFNDDGNLDLSVSFQGSLAAPGSKVAVFLGNGDGTFGTETDYTVGTVPFNVITADLDGDGDTDIAVTNLGTESVSSTAVSILPGNGDGTFGNAVNYTAGSGPKGLAAADFDEDGDLDLAVTNFGSGGNTGNTISILTNQ